MEYVQDARPKLVIKERVQAVYQVPKYACYYHLLFTPLEFGGIRHRLLTSYVNEA